MNFKKTSSALLRMAMCLIALMAFGNMRAQENRIYIPTAAVLDYEVHQIPVYMETAHEVYATDFTVTLPEELQFYGEEPIIPSERVIDARNFSTTQRSQDGRSQYVLLAKTTLPVEPVLTGTDGPVCYLVVKAQPGTIEEKGTCAITITNAAAGSKVDGKIVTLFSKTSCKGTIYMGHDVSKCNIYSSESNIVINPGAEYTITMNMDNNHPNYGMLFHVIMPQGLKVVENSLEITTRCQSSTIVSCKESPRVPNKWVMMLYNDAKETVEGNSGAFCTFKIVADETYDGTSQITFTRVEAVDGDEAHSTVEGTWEPITVVSGKIALDKANAEIAALRAELAQTLANIAEQAPLVKDNFTGDAINSEIDALEAAVNAAYEDMTLTPDYDKVMAPAAGIREAMAKLLADAVAANTIEAERVAANKAAYDADMAKIADLQKKYDETVATIKADYSEFENEEAEAGVQKAINDAKEAVEAAYAAVANEGSYNGSVDNEAIESQIEKLLADAKAAKEAKDEADRVAANKAAYEADLAKIKALQEKFDETVLTIKENYKDFEDFRAEAAVQKAITDAKEAVEAAYAAVANEGIYDGSVDNETIESQIEKLLADAKAAKEAKDEADRVAANKAAYDADMLAIEKIREYYNETVKRIADEYPEYNNETESERVKKSIDEAEEAVKDEYAKVEEEGNYESPLDEEALIKAIDAMYQAAVSGIDGIYEDGFSGDVEIYTLDGQRHNTPVKGQVNIIRMKNGTCKKVYIK